MSETASKPSRRLDTAILVVIGVVVVLGFFMGGGKPITRLVGDEAPAFKLPTRGGAIAGPGDHRGKIVLLDFWASWCNPCLRQMPRLVEVQEIIGPEVQILSVNVDQPSLDREQKIDRFIRAAKVDFDTLVDNGSAAQLYSVQTLPSLVIIDGAGVVRWAGTGVHDTASLVKEISRIRETNGGAHGS